MGTNETSTSKNAPEADNFMLAEYTALREEVLKRVELQHQIFSLTLVVFGTIVTFGLQVHSASIILLYPILSVFLAATWTHDGRSVRTIGIYIRDQIEAKIEGNNVGWEHRARRQPGLWSKFTFLFAGGFNLVSARGIFAGTSLIATLLAIPLAKVDVTDIFLFALASVSILSSIATLRYTKARAIRVRAQEEHAGETLSTS